QVDKSIYEKRRALMQNVLQEAGYTFTPPQGGFYFFPQAPGGDDVKFVSQLQEERVLAVPGSGFGYPGYFRMSFCVEEKVIINAAESLTRARKKIEN
ncbi:MAG TPA: aminotransferase class I/II-fold pyridoxal phosphate-dependent enzyme, partial [Desulfohalobiaceae bacterium]|nr:aminotransferase class I/II-fold pyridoxal phosphate-dependent enzyme [Desulfohalobiaceae bacterium]